MSSKLAPDSSFPELISGADFPLFNQVKTDPAGRQDPIREGAGPITSDSLAAESIRQHGGFSQNRDAAPLGVTSENSTLSNTDTSAATELRPAKDAETRAAYEDQEAAAKKEGGDELGRDAGAAGARQSEQQLGSTDDQPQKSATMGAQQSGQKLGSTEDQPQKSDAPERDASAAGLGSPGGPQQKKQKQDHPQTEQVEDVHPTGESGGSQEHDGHKHGNKHKHKHADEVQGGAAPTYVDVDVVNRPLHGKPKGKNLQEGGFDDEDPNASGTAEIGSENDPGRLAEQKFLRRDAEAAADAGSGPRRKVVTDDGRYDALPSEEQA